MIAAPAAPAGRSGDAAPERSRPEAARPELHAPAALVPALRALLRGRVVIMGIGNPLRGDDAVGSVIARRLAARFAPLPGAARPRLTVIDAEEIPESWLGPAVAARPDVVLLVDAVELGAAPGAATILPAGPLARPALFTHRTPLGPVAEFLARETGATVALLGVQPGDNRWGEALSPELAAAAADLVVLLTDVLEGDGHVPSPTEAIA